MLPEPTEQGLVGRHSCTLAQATSLASGHSGVTEQQRPAVAGRRRVGANVVTTLDANSPATIPQRLMGFGDIIIDNASEIGGSIVMHNIRSPRHYADLLLRELRHWH